MLATETESRSPEPSSLADHGSFVVIGATGGIGSQVTDELAAHGARLTLTGRRPEALLALGRRYGALTRELDATQFKAVEDLLKEEAAEHGRVAGVVNCAGSILLKPAHATSEDEFRAVIETNLTTAFAVVRAAGRSMRDGGSVVLCSSAAAQVGLMNHEAIAAAKAGVEGLVRSAAATYGGKGIRFNAVAPGLVRTELSARITASEHALESSRQMHALQRIGEPEDIASAIVWLLDPRNNWITGQVLGIDGGLARVRPPQRLGAPAR